MTLMDDIGTVLEGRGCLIGSASLRPRDGTVRFMTPGGVPVELSLEEVTIEAEGIRAARGPGRVQDRPRAFAWDGPL